MATEEDVPEPISTTQRVGENISLASGLSDKAVHETSPGESRKIQETLNLPCETAKCLTEPENKQEADNVGAETMNSDIKGNVEVPEGERFLESPSAAVVATEGTCTVSEHCQADEESFQEDKEMSENTRQMQNDTTNGIAQVTGSRENKVVEESEEQAQTDDGSCDIVHLPGTSLQAAKIEELNHGIRGEGSLEEESYIDKHVDVIEDQQDSAEDKSTNKEARDMQKNENDGHTSLEFNKQVSNTTEGTLDQNKEASIHIPDPGVISLNKDDETAADPSNKAESIKAKFTGEELGTTISEVDDKEAEKSTDLVGEEESPEATRLSERVENEKDEKEKTMNDSAGDILASRLATYPDIQSEEESMSKVRDGNKEQLYMPSVTVAGDESSALEAGPETGEKLKEVSSVSCEEKNNNRIEPSEKMEQTSPVEDEMNNKNNIDTSFAVQTEETSLQKLDNPELSEVVPRSWSDDINKERPEEVKERIELIEKTAEGDSTSNEKTKDYEIPEQKEESSFIKHEGTSTVIEVLAEQDISSGENIDEKGSTVAVTEDNNDDTKITDGLEYNHSGKSDHEERPDNFQQNEPEMEKLDASLSTQDSSIAASTTCDDKEAPIKSCEESAVESIIDVSQQSQSGTSNHEEMPEQLQQNKPEKEKLDGSLSLVTVDFGTTAATEYAETISCAKEEAPIKTHEESFAEKIEEDTQTHSEPIIETGIPKDKHIVPAIEVNEKIDDSEVHVPNKEANDVQVTYPLIEAAVQNESKDLDIVSNFEPKGQTHEAYEASTEQKHIEDEPEACQSSNRIISEHASTEMVTSESIPTTSETDVTKFREAGGLDSEENSTIKDSSENKDQDKKANEKAYHSVTHEVLSKGDDAGKDIIDAEASVEVNRAILVTDEMVEQKFHVESPLPAAPTLSGEDETYKPETDAKMNNITNQQVQDGTNIAGGGEATDEQVIKGSVTYNLLESTEQETSESSQHIANEAEKSEGENGEQVRKDDNIGGLVPTTVEQDSVKNLNDEEKKAEKSTGEVNVTVNQTPTEASPEEKRNEDINSYHDELVNAQDNTEKKPSESEEDLQYILQKKKSEEKLEESLPVVSEETRIFSSSTDKFPCLVKEGARLDFEETAEKEEKVNETEESNETKENKIATEKDLKLEAETSEASEESIVLEPKSERDIMVVEEDTKTGESEELHKDSKIDAQGEDTEKQNILEESLTTSILPEPVAGESFKSFKEDQKVEDRLKIEVYAEPDLTGACENAGRQIMEEENTVDQCKELEVKKTVQSSEEDDTTAKMPKQDNYTYISEESIEQETVQSSQDNVNKAEGLQAENRREQIIEEGLIPESIEKDPTHNLNDEKQKTEKSTAKTSETSETAKAVESIAHETSKTAESPREILDISPVKQEENILSEGKTTEASLEEEKNEDISPVVVAEDNSNTSELVGAKEDTAKKSLQNEADLEHTLQENEPGETFSSNADKSPCLTIEGDSENLEEKAQTEENNEARHEKIATEEDLKVVSKTSDASKSVESRVLELNSEMDKVVVEDDTRKGESEEVHVEPDTTSIGEDDEKQITTEESTVEQCRELEVEKIVETSEEDDKIANMSKQGAESIEQETVESSKCITNNAEESEAENNKESVEQDPVKDLDNEIMKAEKSSGEIFEISKTAEATESVAHQTIETLDIVDTSLENERDNLQNEGDNLTPVEASAEGKDEERIPVAVAEENTSVNELLDVKENIEKIPPKTEEDLEHTSQKNEPGEKLDQLLSKEDETEAFSSNADAIPQLREEGASQNEEAARNEEETEQNNESKGIKIAVEEDLKVVAETSDASKSKESISLETKSEMDRTVVGDDIKNRESEELSEDTKDTGNGEDTEKQRIEETCHNTSILPEPVGEKAPQSYAEEEKEEATPKIEIFENPDTTRAAESVAHETGETTESTKELLDTSPVEQEEDLHSEGKSIEGSLKEEKNEDITPVMVADEKSNANELVNAEDDTKNVSSKSAEELERILQKSEPGENLEQSLPMTPDEIEVLSSNADKTPCSMVEGASQNLEETAQIQEKTEESIEQETVESSHDNVKKAEESEAENRREQIIEEGLIPESVEKDPTHNLNDEKQKTEKSTGETSETSETAKAVESIAHETSKTTESPKEILDISPVKQEENILREGKTTEASVEEEKNEDIYPVVVAEENSNTNELVGAKEDIATKSSKNEADFEHILQKNEPGETFSSNADNSPCLTVEGDSEEVHVEPDTTSIREESEKQITNEGSTVEQCRELEVEKIVQTSEEDDKVANMSKQGAESIERETVESSKCITNNAEESEAENNKESVEQDPVKDLDNEKMKAEKSSGEIFETSKTAEAAESSAHETIETLDIVDTSLENKRDILQNEGDNLTPVEASAEGKDEERTPVAVAQENTSVIELLDAKENIEKNPPKTEEDLEHISQKNEPGEKLDQSLSKEDDETEAFSSNADEIPQLMEEGASQNEEAARNEEIEQNIETKDNKIAVEEDLKVVAETSDASNSNESIALETKSEMDRMVDGDGIKHRESEELSEDTKDAGNGKDIEKQSTAETCHNTSILPEPVGEKAPQSYAEEEKEEETPKIEIFENPDTTRAAESVAHETGETTESPKELLDTCPVKQEEDLHSEGKSIEGSLKEEKNEDITPVMVADEKSNANELVNAEDDTKNISSKSAEELERILQKSEPGENLELSLPMTPDEIELLSSNADKTPCSMVEGASQNLEETAQIQEKTEENSEAMHDKIVTEEDLNVVVKTSEASKSIESTLLEHESESDKMVVEDNTKKAESKEVHVEPDTASIGEDAEEHIKVEENTIEQCRGLEAEKIEQNSDEDDKIAEMSKQGNVTYISMESVEQETVESPQGNANTTENSEAENNNEYTMEDGNNRGLIPEPVEQDPVKNLNDEKMEAEKSLGEIFEISKATEAAESSAHETIETLDIVDNSLENKRGNLQNEGDSLAPIEASPEEKYEDRSPVAVAQENTSVNVQLDAKENIEKNPSKTEEDLEHILQKNEPGEKLDQSFSKEEDETEAFSSNADKIPQLMEEGASQNEEAARSEEETEQNNESKDNKIAVEEDLQVVAETSDASKSKESIALEPKSEMDKIVDGDDIKTRDSEESSQDSKDTVKGEDTEKQNIAEACHTTSILPEYIGEQAFQGSAEEEKEEETPKIEAREIAQTVNESEDTGKQNIEEASVAESNIEVLVRETDEEDSLKNENREKEHEEEVDGSNPAFIENTEATNSTKETVSETLKDRAESNVVSHHLDVTKASEEEEHPEEIKEDLVEKSVSLSDEDSKEEITTKEETKFDYSDSVSATVVKEEAGLQGTEAEDRNQAESFGLVSEEKGITETETREITLESGDLKVTPEDTSNLSEVTDKDDPEVAGEDRTVKEEQNEVPHAVNEDQEEVATNTMPLKETLEDELNKHSTLASEERKLKSSEDSETVDETPENIQAPDENEGTFVVKAIDEKLMQTHDTTNPLNVSELRSIDAEKETANEAQEHKVDDLYVHPKPENEKDLSISEDVEILKRVETRELTDQSDIRTSKTSQDVESSDLGFKMEETQDGKPIDEALKCTESPTICTEIEKANIEQEISEGNLHEGVNVEKAAIEQKEEAYSQTHEDTSTHDDETLTEENLKSVDADQKFGFASESVAEDQSKQIPPESDKSEIEENDKKKNQQDDEKIKENEEPTLEVEENKEQNANEITQAVIFNEKAPDGVEQLDEIEDIKEPVIEKEQGRHELHELSTVGETTNQVKDSTLVCSDAKVTESKEKTDTENSEVEEDSTRQREASVARQPEEQEQQDVSIETPAEELEEKEKEKILEESEDYCSKNDNGTMTLMTAEKSSEQAEEVDKLLKASNIDPEPSLVTSETENTHQNKEIDIVKLEETSCDLTSNLPTVYDSHAEQESITVENTEASECVETKVPSEAFHETKDQGTEETDLGTTVEKKNQVLSYDHDHSDKENLNLEISDKNEVEETKIASAADQGTEGTSEIGESPTVERMDQVQSSNSEHVEKESMAVENPKEHEVNESNLSSDAIYVSQHQGTDESAGKTSTVEIPDQVPNFNSEHAQNESVTEENPDADDADETKMDSNVVFEVEDKATKDIDEIRKTPTTEKQDAYKNEEASDYRAHEGESVRKDEITIDPAESTEKLEEQLPALNSATATTIEKLEEEKTKEVEMLEGESPEDSSVANPTEDTCLQKEVSRELDVSTLGLNLNKDMQECPTEVPEEEGQNPDAALQLKPQENNNKIECGDSSSESKNTTDLTGPTETGSDLKFETSEKTLESEMVMHNHGLTESEDAEIKEKDLVAVINDIRAEENQLKQTSEANEITQKEVSDGEITEEKEAAKTHHPASLQEDELKTEESVKEKTNTININSPNAIQNEELSVSTASKNIEEQVATSDRSVQDPEQVSGVNTSEFEAKDAKDAAIELGPINQGEETNVGSGKTETTTPREEELGIEISQKESIRGSVNGSNLIQDIQDLENTDEKQIPTGKECAPSVLQEGITEVRDFEPGHTREVHSETEGEKIAGDSEEETIKEPVKTDTDKASLSAVLQTSRKERELTASPEGLQTEQAEDNQIREAKTGEEKDEEEEGDEHKKTDLSFDSPVVVDVARDMDVKVAHKKSYGILSGVGSKVKHSISKVKKAITGKSSHHPKPVSPK